MSSIMPSLVDAQAILRRYISDARILEHSLATQQKSLTIASLISSAVQINFELVSVGSLLHDIGRARIQDITHGYIGGRILREEGLDHRLIYIVERHVLGGFTAQEAVLIGLPRRSFLPKTWEEKIVTIADKLGHYYWDGIGHPDKWRTKMRQRFTRLSRRYGGGEPFKTSMMRAERYLIDLEQLASKQLVKPRKGKS